MELDLRKTAADAAYIAVGAGVLGFQQAQVRRKEAAERTVSIRRLGRQGQEIAPRWPVGHLGGEALRHVLEPCLALGRQAVRMPPAGQQVRVVA